MAIEVDFHTRQKIKSFELWFQDDHLLVHVDSRVEEVIVPQHLKNNHALTLKLSSLFQGKTTYDSKGITAFLKFSGDYFECFIPWKTVWGMTSAQEENTIWPDDLPRELVFQFAKAKVKELGGRLLNSVTGKEDQDSEEQPNGPTRSDTTAELSSEKEPHLQVAPQEAPKGPRLVRDAKSKSKRKPPELKRIK